MAKKKVKTEVEKDRIPVEDIVVGGVYKTYVQEIVKVLKKDEDRQEFVLFNVNGAFKQWTAFRHIWLTKFLYQSR